MEKMVKKHQTEPCVQNIAAVIVTYNPDGDFSRRLNYLISQVAYIIIVDNASSFSVQRMLEGAVLLSKSEIINNNHNVGIATALNQGVRRAAELGFSWVLTLDQDTSVDNNMVNTLTSIYNRYPSKERIGIIGSNSRSKHSGRLFINCKDTEDSFVELKTVITSGSLMPLSVYKVTGPFRDDFFIEAVDLEYCLRLRKYGYKVLFSCQPLMTHVTGKMEEHNFLGRTILVDNHPPWRYYYRLRNFLRITKTYFWREPAWIFSTSFSFVKMFVKIIMFESNKLSKFSYMLCGFWDAFFNPARVIPIGNKSLLQSN